MNKKQIHAIQRGSREDRHDFASIAGSSAIMLVMLLNFSTFAGDGKDKEIAEVLAQVPDSGFSWHIIDSIKTKFHIEDNRALWTQALPIALADERLTFEASWGPIRAGFCEAIFHRDTGSRTATISIKAGTNNFVSSFFKARDFIRSTADADGLYPLLLEEHIQEGRYRDRRWSLFNQRDGFAYTSQEDKPRLVIPRFSHDFLTALYFIRSQHLSPGDSFSLTVVTDGKCWPVPFICTKKERLKIDIGSFDCVVVNSRPQAESRTLSKKDQITIWFTDDLRHIPVMIKSKINVGSIVAQLIDYSPSL